MTEKITITGQLASVHPDIAVAGLGATMEALTLLLRHQADCVRECPCGGRDACCVGCGQPSGVVHSDDCVRACELCFSADVLGDLVPAFTGRILLTAPLEVSVHDLALMLLCSSLGMSAIGDVFGAVCEMLAAEYQVEWAPVMEHFEVLAEYVKTDALHQALSEEPLAQP